MMIKKIPYHAFRFLSILSFSGKKKGKGKPTNEKPLIGVQILKNGVPVSNTVTCEELFSGDNSDLTLRVGDQDFCFVTNAPFISNIELPKSIMCGFLIYVRKLEGPFIDEAGSEFLWFRCQEGEPDQAIASGPIYVPTTADIGHRLKLICTPVNSDGVKGPTVEICSPCEVEAGPGRCPFEDRHAFSQRNLTGNS